MSFLLTLRGIGIVSTPLLRAFEAVPRRIFVDDRYSDVVNENRAFPIPCGQTQPAPTDIARLLAALNVEAGRRVLLVGTGSGYAAAVLATIALSVVAIDRYVTLAEAAQRRFRSLGIGNAVSLHGDGCLGYPEAGPYDRIVVMGAVKTMPEALLEALLPEGVLVAVLRNERGGMMTRMTKSADGSEFQTDQLGRLDLAWIVPGRSKLL